MLRDLGGNGGRVAARDETHVEGRARKPVPFRLRAPGHRARRSGAAMKTAFDGRDVRPARHAQRYLERVLVRLGAAVDEEHTGEGQPREAYQAPRGSRAHPHRDRVALELTDFGLACQRRRPGRMRIPQACDRVSAVQIEHPLPKAVGEPYALRRCDFQRVLPKYRGEKIACPGGRLNPAVRHRSRWLLLRHSRALRSSPARVPLDRWFPAGRTGGSSIAARRRRHPC
jgi:hypothetical protein